MAGARDKFEDLASQLVKGEQPDAGKVRIKQGDSGIDVHVGELSSTEGIDVYQCKFFPQGLGESQKDQIRKSFRECKDSTFFKAKTWTLCLPVDLSIDEKRWFEDWKTKQANAGIVIREPWGAMKLEGLLYQEKNRGLKEAFFKEEHLTQIRELHGMMQRLIAEIGQRLQEDAAQRQQTQKAGVLARQTEYFDEFLGSMRESYEKLTRPGPISYSKQQQAVKAGDEAALRAIKKAQQRLAHWEISIRPSWLPEHPQIRTLKECSAIVEACQVRSNGWEYPVIAREAFETGSDWLGSTRIYQREVESWRLSQRGLFVHMFPVWDDVQGYELEPEWFSYTVPPGFVAKGYLDIDIAIRTFTSIFRFASRFAEKAFDAGEGATDIRIRITNTRDRALVTTNDPRRLRGCYRATEPELEHVWHCKREELAGAADTLAIKAALWFFERFGWYDASEVVLSNIQRRLFPG